jgi:hypothetical protein
MFGFGECRSTLAKSTRHWGGIAESEVRAMAAPTYYGGVSSMATKYVGDKGGIAAWREAHDAMGKLLEAAEDEEIDERGKVAVDFAACRDGYEQLAGMFGSSQRASADSARGMALDRLRRAAAQLDLEKVFPQSPQCGSANARVRVSALDEIFAPISL